jgi:riboflavin biosynthesis pyrimidine reductase
LPYLAYLRQERIPYLLAGAHRVDLTSALAKIRTQLGAECLVSEAGGGLNGALLRAGLVDELHIITIPALIGGLGTPSIMDGPPLEPGSLPAQLRAIDVQVGAHGTIWAHYEVVASAAAGNVRPTGGGAALLDLLPRGDQAGVACGGGFRSQERRR